MELVKITLWLLSVTDKRQRKNHKLNTGPTHTHIEVAATWHSMSPCHDLHATIILTGPKKKNLCSSSEDAMVQAQKEWKWKRNEETTWRRGRFPITQQARQGSKKECRVKELLNLCKKLTCCFFFFKKKKKYCLPPGEKGAEGWWMRRTVCAASSLNDKLWAAVSDVGRSWV